MKINDVVFSEQFWIDWEKVPPKIQTKFNNIISNISRTKTLLPSIQAHRAKNWNELSWIGYVSTGVHAHRFLFSVSSSGTMVIERLLDHNAMDALMR